MTPAALSIKRPIFISCLLILLCILGYRAMSSMPLDLYPDVTEPTITIEAIYDGAGPNEVEAQIARKIEDEISTIAGIKKVSSTNKEGIAIIGATFHLSVNIDNAEQEVRAKIGNIRRELPEDMKEPVIRKVSTSDSPIMRVALESTLPDGQFFDLADQTVRPRIEQIQNVGRVDILGGRKREVHVELESEKLKYFDISASQVAGAFQGGRNIPAGNLDQGETQTSFRTQASYVSFQEIASQLVRFTGAQRAIEVGDVAKVTDGLQDESSRTYLDGRKVLLIDIYRQSGANTVAVIDAVKLRLQELEKSLSTGSNPVKLSVVMDRSKTIQDNIYDVKESIIIGIILTIIVVYFFLGSVRSTIITNLALPNSLLGAFVFMSLSGFTLNLMSLLGLSVVVGLLIDDAIVVRENIHKHLERGVDSTRAAYKGTIEMMLPVISTTFAVLAVFGPIGTLSGVTGQWFRQFGLTVCFAMAISLFDAITIAPMLSAYFAGKHGHGESQNIIARANRAMLNGFNAFQTKLEKVYASTLKRALQRPSWVLGGSVGIFVICLWIASMIPGTFISAQDNGEFGITYDLPLGSGFDATEKIGNEIAKIVKADSDVEYSLFTVGNRQKEAQKGEFYIRLIPSKQRTSSTSDVKERLRQKLAHLSQYNVKLADVDLSGGNMRGFNLNISGLDQKAIEDYAQKIFAKLKSNPDLVDVDISVRPGKPEYVIERKAETANITGVSLYAMGQELRTRVEGATPAIFTENSIDYDVRVRMNKKERNLLEEFKDTKVANSRGQTIALPVIANMSSQRAPSEILRENRAKYVSISADLSPTGAGLAGVIESSVKLMTEEEKIPDGMKFSFPGQGEDYADLSQNMLTALGLGVMLIYLVLASLYESFFKPFTIMMVIPLAACGAFVALFVTGSYLDLFAMIGCILLMGLATKNSILLLDAVEEYVKKGKTLKEALVLAGESRLRPILMTSCAMIGGMVPIAIGLNEASKSRTSLGIVVIGGVISSTLLTLYTIPAVAIYMSRVEKFFFRYFNRFVRPEVSENSPRPQDVIDGIIKE